MHLHRYSSTVIHIRKCKHCSASQNERQNIPSQPCKVYPNGLQRYCMMALQRWLPPWWLCWVQQTKQFDELSNGRSGFKDNYLWDYLGFQHVNLVSKPKATISVVSPHVYETKQRLCQKLWWEGGTTNPVSSSAKLCCWPEAIFTIFFPLISLT